MKPRIRCSNLDRLILCPGSRTLEARVEKRDSGEGDEGTAVHAHIAATLIIELGASGELAAPLPKLALNSQWLVGFCVRECREKLPDDWSLEVEVPLAYSFDKFELSGHIDALALSPDATEAIAWDWKTVYNAVDIAEQNEQALGYVANLKRAYPSLRKVTFYIVQPRVDEEMGFQRVSSVSVDTSEGMMNNFERRIERSLAFTMGLDSGPKQCRFCSAKLQCPAVIAERESMKMTITEEQLAKIKAQPDDATLGDWVVSAKTLESSFETAREIAKERIAKQGYITAGNGTNIAVKVTAGSYEVVDRDQFQASLLSIIPAERLAHCTKPSMTEIKKEIAAACDVPLAGKAAINATTIFDGKLRPFVQQGERHILTFS